MLEKPLNLKGEKMGYYSLTEITAVQYAKDYGYFEERQMSFVMKWRWKLKLRVQIR